MPTPAYALVKISVNGGALQTGGIVVAYSDVIQLSGESTVGWTQQRWEIVYYPTGFATPAGWTLDVVTGVIYSVAVVPPPFTMPVSTTWGKWMFRLRVNDAITNASALQRFTDAASAVQILAGTGLKDYASTETTQFRLDNIRDQQDNLRIIDAGLGGGGGGGPPSGAAGGDLGGNYPNPNVLKIHGTTVPAGGGLTIGNVLQVTGVAAATWAAINLAGGAGFVTGSLPIANFTPGTSGQVFVTAAGPATAWVTPAGDWTGAVTANVVGKIKGTTVTTAGGALTTGFVLRVTGIATADWGLLDATASLSPGTANQFFVTNGAGTAPAWATAAGDWTGPVTVNVVGRIKGTTVTTAGGALAVGLPLRTTAVATADWGTLDGTVALSPGGASTFLQTNGSSLVVWAAIPASALPASTFQFQNVADIAAMQALVVTTFPDGTHCWVRSVKRAYILDTNAQTPSADLDTYVSATAGRVWMGAE